MWFGLIFPFQLKESQRVYGSGVILQAGVEKDAVVIQCQLQTAVGPDSSGTAGTALDLQILGAVWCRNQRLSFWLSAKAASEISAGPRAPTRLWEHLPICQGWWTLHKLLFPHLASVEKLCWWFWQ